MQTVTPTSTGRPLRRILAIVALSVGGLAHAQYPKITSKVAAESARPNAQMQRHSDEAWKQALPAITASKSLGKPFIPWAVRPSDLPQADIPAFPGAEGEFAEGRPGSAIAMIHSEAIPSAIL